MEVVPMGEEKRRGSIFGVPKQAAVGFVEFVRERGVMGLAIGFVLGSAVQKVVTAFVNDLVNPLITLFLGRAESFKTFAIGRFMIGDFVAVLIDFFVLLAIVYTVFKLLGLDKLDKPQT